LDQIRARVPALPGKSHKLGDFAAQLALGGCANNLDPATRRHLEQPFVTECAQGTQRRVGVDTHHSGEMTSGRQPISWLCVAFGDGPADLSRNLLVKVRRIAAIKIDIPQCAN